MKPVVLELRDVHYSYRLAHQDVAALRGLSLNVREGEMVAIQGPSGSGKSTLLYLLGCMLRPDLGHVRILGQDVGQMSDAEMAYFRNRKLGFVFQQFHLLPAADVLTNILLPSQYPLEEEGSTRDKDECVKRATQLARQFGLEDRLHHGPQQLSGGQQQRVAIARALVREAPIVLADEPTGNLDSATSLEIMKELRRLNEQGKTIVIITHDAEIAKQCDRVIWIRDGRVFDPKTGDVIEAPTTPLEPVKKNLPRLHRLNWETLVRHSLPSAWANVSRYRMRTFLTMLGVIVGVASVLSMLTLGSYTKERILQSYATLGINTLSFYAYKNWSGRGRKQAAGGFQSLDLARDVLPLRQIFPQIQRMTPLYTSWGHSAIYGGRAVENEVTVAGVNENYLLITRTGLAAGRPLTSFHVTNQSSVCLIGFELAQKLFQHESPIDKVIQVAIDTSAFSCVVIGVVNPIPGKDGRGDRDLQVTLPYTSFVAAPVYHYARQLSRLLLEIDLHHDVEQTGKMIQAYFTKRYGSSGDFRASSDSVLVAQMKRFLNLFTALLVSIAGLSLVVGGMGITNMMLVSVNERFREIGLRKAMGASHSAIRQLFFAEALFLCGVAGVLGLLVGFVGYQTLLYFGSRLIPNLEYEWVVNPWALLVSFLAIAITGVLSGLGPALRAEKLQVIEALRAE